MALSSYDPTSPEETPIVLPSAPLITLNPNAVLQPPLTRRGHGPGLIAFLPAPCTVNGTQRPEKTLDPEPVQKWAEEGFAVVGLTTGTDWNVQNILNNALDTLMARDEVDTKNGVGIIVYDPHCLSSILDAASRNPRLVCAVSYGAHAASCALPFLSHVPNTHAAVSNSTCYKYPVATPLFVLPLVAGYHASSAALAHTRSLLFLRTHIGGPQFDIEAVWDEHTFFEFTARSVAKTMGTMVAEPYVNHVPTMTGGMGRKNLTAFYRDHFIFSNPADIALETISRTVGADRIIDEFIVTMTHDRTIDWLLPGVPPSGRKLAIPMMSVVNVRGDRLYHEHIWWDQAGVLKQVGAIPACLPYPLPDGKQILRLPVAGAEAAALLADETAGTSNEMLGSAWGVSGL